MNRAEIVWILDAVEDDHERRVRRAADDLLNAVVGDLLDFSDHTLMHAAV